MYESPITLIMSELDYQLEGNIMRAVQDIGISIDKEELFRALKYDRGQYKNGFDDGYNQAIKDIIEKLKEEL